MGFWGEIKDGPLDRKWGRGCVGASGRLVMGTGERGRGLGLECSVLVLQPVGCRGFAGCTDRGEDC